MFLKFLVEFVDVGLKISTGCHYALNLSVEGCFFFSEFEELLGVSHGDIFLEGNLLLQFFLLGLLVLVGFLSYFLGIFKFLGQFEFVSKLDFIGFKFGFFILQSLLLLQQLLILNIDGISFVGPLS